eukprot:COSAG06_NODE_30526_length_537_cov_1.216895_1_plen_65_part_00
MFPVRLSSSWTRVSSHEYVDAISFLYDSGSTVDAMSDAIEGADVMLYGVSLRYKESANVSRVAA